MWYNTLLVAQAAAASSHHAAAELYEDLYAHHGYHSDLKLTHAAGIWPIVVAEHKKNPFTRGILDVGCSHGKVVEKLWHNQINAFGVDISPTAVKMADAARNSSRIPRRCGGQPCFQAASATRLPFDTASVDVIISSDVLEHLTPVDVPTVVREFGRVARRFAGKIGRRMTGSAFEIHLGAGRFRFVVPAGI